MKIKCPKREEYNEFYHGYVSKVSESNVVHLLHDQLDKYVWYVKSIDHKALGHKYAEGKWTIAEVLGHMIDTERVFSYRILSIARGDVNILPGFDQDVFVSNGAFEHRTLASFLAEMTHLRRSNIEMIASFTDEILDRQGMANNVNFTVRALVFILAGHFQHHFDVLTERYFID
jgi:DNA-dependent RNA polymerase auxiliary subunit epsilon